MLENQRNVPLWAQWWLVSAMSLMGVGCGDPQLLGLSPQGPPEVVTVTVLHHMDIEVATFCAQGADVLVSRHYCPEARDQLDYPIAGDRPFSPVTHTRPVAWYTRIVFDELLATSVEELRDDDGDGRREGHIDNTAPVVLQCAGTEIRYDGFYNPAGSFLSDPPGPGLVIIPLDPFPAATSSACTVGVNASVTDKANTPVPEAGRGPFAFHIAPLTLIGSLPENSATGVDPDSFPVLAVNAPIAIESIGPDDIRFVDGSENPVDFAPLLAPDDPTLLTLVPAAPLLDNTPYAVTLARDAALSDVHGGTLTMASDITISFTTGMRSAP